MVELAAFALLLAAAGAGAWWLARLLRRELGALRAETAAHLADRNADVDRRLQAMTATMDRRLESASRTTTEIHRQLGKVDQANAEILDRAKDLARLEQALRPPKARGGFGEILLANLLADTFPRDKYDLQHTFRDGERVDAVIRLDRALVPVDAKFPLDNFQRLVEAESDADRTLYAKQFCRDVKSHVDAIAQKYIRPDEGTYEFALMYLPAEAVYYELVCNRLGGDASPLTYALERRVIPVSPSTLHAYLLVIVLGFKGMQIEEHAREVVGRLAQLGKDFGRFREDFELLGTHLGRAQTKFGDAERRLSRFEAKLERAAEADLELAPAERAHELPRALDAA